MQKSTNDAITCLLAEFLGTALLLFLGCMGCAGFENSLFKGALNFGFAVMLIIHSLGCVSGAHLSPPITLSAYIMSKISPMLAVGYVCAQVLGCYAGYALLMLLTPTSFLPIDSADIGFCLTLPHPQLSYLQALIIEFVITSTLVLMVCSLWDPRYAKYGQTTALKFCFGVFGLACSAGNFTGASMNPARSLAPALWNNNFENQGIYWIGPLSASIAATYLYKLVFWREV